MNGSQANNEEECNSISSQLSFNFDAAEATPAVAPSIVKLNQEISMKQVTVLADIMSNCDTKSLPKE